MDTPAAILTVKAYLERWLEAKVKQLKESTWVEYRRVVNHVLIPKFGALALIDLKRAHVKEWLVGLEVTNKRLLNLQSIFRSALQDAVNDDILEINPLHGWTYRNRDVIKEDDDVDPFTADEQAAILKAAEGQFKNLIQFALWSGLRTSEMVGLDWSAVDFDAGVVTVSKVKTQKSKNMEVPKTRGSARKVKLLAGAVEALQAQKQHTFLGRAEVFQDPRWLRRWTGDQPIRNMWLKTLKAAEVRYRRPYQTRHTYASMMLSSGEPPQWVAAQLGHTSTQMITRTYGRFMPEALPDAGSRADALFRKTS